jgi:hypothetical protein
VLQLTCHYDLFSQTVQLNKAISQCTFICFKATSAILYEHRSTLYCYRLRTFAVETMLYNTQYFMLLTVTRTSTTLTECIVAFQLQKWLLERATILLHSALSLVFVRSDIRAVFVMSSYFIPYCCTVQTIRHQRYVFHHKLSAFVYNNLSRSNILRSIPIVTKGHSSKRA